MPSRGRSSRRPADAHARSRPRRLLARGLAARLLAAAPAAGLVAGCSGPSPSALSPDGPGAARVANLWWFLFALAVVACVVVVALLAWALARRRGPGVRIRSTSGERFVVIAGIAVPALVLTVVYAVNLRDLRALAAPGQPPAATVEVIGHEWWWEVRYPDRGVVTANEIHVPAGVPVQLRLQTADVNHSFWVPELMPKTDLVAGRVNDMWLTAQPGTYRGRCAEYCGLQHAHMAFLVVADPPAQFDAWVAQQRQPAQQPADPLAAQGREVLQRAACASCHTVSGTSANGKVGPDLTHVGSRDRLGAGAVPNTRGYLGGWISNSQSIKPGNKMPPQPLSPEDLRALVAYLETLR